MDNEFDQSKVAYEDGPKEVNTQPRMPNSEKQTGKGNKMPQDEKSITVKKSMKHYESHSRHKEHR